MSETPMRHNNTIGKRYMYCVRDRVLSTYYRQFLDAPTEQCFRSRPIALRGRAILRRELLAAVVEVIDGEAVAQAGAPVGGRLPGHGV